MFDGKLAFLIAIPSIMMIPDIKLCSADLPMPNGINYCGIGYNIIEGNPEGGDLSTGGVDPGLLLTRRIFQLTFEQEKTSADQQYQIPDEVIFVPRNSVFTTSSLSTFYGTKSYASKLSAQVEVEGGYEGATASVKFAASARYQGVSQKTSSGGSVFLSNETIHNHGLARYQTELALTGQHGLANGFVADACRLPADYTENDYMDFLDDWGTHVVTEVALGIREGENMEEKLSSFVNYAAQNVEGSVSASGSYAGFSASLSVNMESFTSAMDSGTSFGKSYSTYRVGSESLNEPISVKLIAMPEVLEPEFWTRLDDYITAGHCTASFDRNRVKENMANALQGYGEWKRIEDSTNPDIRIALSWPEGNYGLPRPFNGCPNKEFTWDEGHRIHAPSMMFTFMSRQSTHDLLWAGWWALQFVRDEFCIKTVSTVNSRSPWEWQPGSYCVYKYGSACPQGFESGYIRWDDDNTYASTYNSKSGILPAGEYGDDTKINFCCRGDGVTSHEIHLPTDDNFMLLARYDRCQLVHGMSVRKEWRVSETEDDSKQSEVHPFNGVVEGNYGRTWHGVRLVYCFYHVGDIVPTDEEKQAIDDIINADRLKIEALQG